MRCPFCGNENHKVVDKRESGSESIRRRRECLKCGKRFTTFERLDLGPLYVIKRDETRQEFNREKVKAGIFRAIEKRSVSTEKVDEIVDNIENKIRSTDANEMSTKKIGEMVMKALNKIDKVAYIRFASVYKDFEDVDSFKEEIEKLLNRKKV